ALEADQVLTGASALAIGRRVAIEELTVRDVGDGRDDEGSPTCAVALIDRGVVGGMLLDRLSAAIAGGASTGNGRRSDFRAAARPRMRRIEVAAGTHDPAALHEGTALRVERFRQGRIETHGGRFTIEVEVAREIRRGRLGRYRRDLRITGDVVATLGAI